jgi:hypothetical protein
MVDEACAMTAHASQIRVDQQAADQRGMVVLQAGFLKAGRGKLQQCGFLDPHKPFRWLIHETSFRGEQSSNLVWWTTSPILAHQHRQDTVLVVKP